MLVSLIVAAGENNCIGKNNTLPWHMPADMQYFKEKTMGHCVISGRKNYESIPMKFRPLPGRTNFVVTRNKAYEAPGAIVVTSLEAAISQARERGESEAFVIGGGELFRAAMPLANRIYLTRIHHDFDGDIFFPEMPPSVWKETERHDYPPDAKHRYGYSFRIYENVAAFVSE